MKPWMAVGPLVLTLSCSRDAEPTAFIQLQSEVSPSDAQTHVEAACEMLYAREPDLAGVAVEAREASRLDERWTLFYLAITEPRDWFDAGTDERVINLTCQGPPLDSADLEVELRRPLSEFDHS